MAWMFVDDRPIYAQIVEKLKLRIISEQYKPGEKMPSVRELAFEAGVNPNTMQKSLVELEREGLIQTFRTTGRVVTEDEEKIHTIKFEIAKDRVESFLSQMRELGFDTEQTLKLIKVAEKEQK